MTTEFSRRRFLATSATSAASAVLLTARRSAAQSPWTRFGLATSGHAFFGHAPTDPATLKTLAAAALDAAKRAGATYADVRFRFTQHESWVLFRGTTYPVPTQTFTVGVGVRALVHGYWGIAGTDGVLASDAMAQLGRDAAAQAFVSAKGPARDAELARTPVVSDGQWTMPVTVDPFTVSYEEKADCICGMADYLAKQAYGIGTMTMMNFLKETRGFASSEGSFCTQTIFSSGVQCSLGTDRDWMTERGGGRNLDFISAAGAGWEYITHTPYQDRAMGVIEDALRQRRPKPVDIGRYDVVFDAVAMANIVDCTIGGATELERAMGFQAAEGGTSFLDDPLVMLGTYQIGSPLVTVSSNRSMPGGGATVKWDDEGVEPADTALVTKGIVTDFQTTRESASWLAPYAQKTGRTVRSSGSAGSDEATGATQTWPSNFVLAPDTTHDASFDDLVAQAKKGYAIKGGYAYSDFQCLNGWANGNVVYEIVNGKLGSAVAGSQVNFRAPEFWKNVVALGGSSSAESVGVRWGRTVVSRRLLQSRYPVGYTVRAVPALVTQLAMTDVMRKA